MNCRKKKKTPTAHGGRGYDGSRLPSRALCDVLADTTGTEETLLPHRVLATAGTEKQADHRKTLICSSGRHLPARYSS